MQTIRSINLKKFLTFQVLLVVVGSVIALFFGLKPGLSYLLGAGVMIVANMLMLWRFFIRKKVFSPMKELMFLYLGEVLKLTLVVIGTIVIATYIKPIFMVYFLGLIILQVAMWLMPFFLNRVG